MTGKVFGFVLIMLGVFCFYTQLMTSFSGLGMVATLFGVIVGLWFVLTPRKH